MKKKEYLYTFLVVAFFMAIIFILKGLYPFGTKSLIWGDLHQQITPMYYYFYDTVYNGKSLLISFLSGGGVNFFGIMSYYIVSPFTLIVLFFSREMIPQAVNIIISLKFIICALTFLYFIRQTFPKLNSHYRILFSIMYAFSSYNLILYLIPNWLDVVYLFPLLIVGLKRLLDEGNIKLFITIMTLSLVFNFYLSLITLIIIFFLSFLYLIIYKKEKNKSPFY